LIHRIDLCGRERPSGTRAIDDMDRIERLSRHTAELIDPIDSIAGTSA
jgi:hypothetical protein